MHYSYLQKKGKKRLLAIFADWGVDFRHFPKLKSRKCDILLIWDYSDLESNILSGEEAFPYLISRAEKYNDVNIIAWGHGIIAAEWAIGEMDSELGDCIAVNGVTVPVENATARFKNLLENISEEAAQQMYAMMIEPKDRAGVPMNSQVNIAAWKQEVDSLTKLAAKKERHSRWNLSIVSRNNSLYDKETIKSNWSDTPIQETEWPYYPDFQAIINQYID